MSATPPTRIFATKASHYVLGGFALATAISWNSAIKEILHKRFSVNGDSVLIYILYAVILTCVLVVLIYFLPDTTNELPKPTQKIVQKHKIEYLERELKDLRSRIHKTH
jgi:hypothetical protein